MSNTRTCPYPDCGAVIERSMFACQPHWNVLPDEVQAKIWRAYRSDSMHDLADAHDQAKQFYAAHAKAVA